MPTSLLGHLSGNNRLQSCCIQGWGTHGFGLSGSTPKELYTVIVPIGFTRWPFNVRFNLHEAKVFSVSLLKTEVTMLRRAGNQVPV
jgi:hypothetical protein